MVLVEKMPWDTTKDALRALQSGWWLNDDGWWVRRMKPGDVLIPPQRPEVGFNGTDEKVYVRSAEWARVYDESKATGTLH